MKKPLKTSSYYTDENFNIVKLTKTQVRKIALEKVKRLNNGLKRNGYKYRYKLVGIKDCDTHWNYSIV